jgi:hypothetical protein
VSGSIGVFDLLTPGRGVVGVRGERGVRGVFGEGGEQLSGARKQRGKVRERSYGDLIITSIELE